jgi:sarcosine oxidase delta subunit
MKTKAIELLKEEYLKQAPNGFFETRRACLGDDVHISIGLIKEQRDCSNNIRENDSGYGVFTIRENDEGLQLERYYHRLSCKPESKYYAMSHKKVSYRIIKSKSPQDLAKKFSKYLTRFFDMVKEEVANDNLYRNEDIKNVYLESIA